VFQLGLSSLRRHRADFFDFQGVGRLEDRQGGPEPDGRSNVGAGDQLPESRHRVGGQRPDFGPERPILGCGECARKPHSRLDSFELSASMHVRSVISPLAGTQVPIDYNLPAGPAKGGDQHRSALRGVGGEQAGREVWLWLKKFWSHGRFRPPPNDHWVLTAEVRPPSVVEAVVIVYLQPTRRLQRCDS
jgi:hypothetical protein